MLKEILNRILNFFSRLIPTKSPISQQKDVQIVIAIDPMEPYEKAAEERRLATWQDIELSDVTQGTIKYKI